MLSYLVAAAMRLDLADRQRLLEQPDTAARLSAELALLRRETALVAALQAVPATELTQMPYGAQLTTAPPAPPDRRRTVHARTRVEVRLLPTQSPTKECHMPSTVKGVIARAKGAPVEVVDVVVPDPGPGEAVVRIQACGVCHTDLHYREGGINDEFPFLLGHEAAGVVEAVGEGVTDVAPGRLRHPQLAGRLRAVPGLRQGQAAVLLQHRTTPPRR